MMQRTEIRDYRLWVHSDGNNDVFRILFTIPQVDESRREAIIEIPFSELEPLLPLARPEKLPLKTQPDNGGGDRY